MALSDEKFNEMNERYEKAVEGLVCDNCNSGDNVVATVRGKPGPDLMEFVQRGGKVKLGGCTTSSKGYCTACSHFIQ